MPADSYDDCWLRYGFVEDDERRAAYEHLLTHAFVSQESPELGAVRAELRRGLEGLLGREPHLWQHPPRSVDGMLAVGSPERMPPVRAVVEPDELEAVDDEGFVVRTGEWDGADVLVVTAPTDRGLVYGTFHLLRRLSAGAAVADLDVVEEPATADRLVNHWDDPFRRSVERGYAGQSIFDWERLPDRRERYVDYARLLASVGINGIVLNNVNTAIPGRERTNEATDGRDGWQLLEPRYLRRLEAMAAVFRPYGIRTYLSVNFASPMLLGGLDTADPLDSEVRDWWERKAAAVYDHVPDFGGLLVKADSEGQPGPHEYDRTHAEGANAIAGALAPHGGRVYWRAFVYHDHHDRAVQPYETFAPLDGSFDENVTLQVKNGPVDFQPREPVSPLFAAMTETDLACELQVTGEYVGQGVHCCYLVPQWREYLGFDTDGRGTPLWSLLDGDGEGFAAVAGVGEDPGWFGNRLLGANLYGYGRLAWDPELDAGTVAEEWARGTFGTDEAVVDAVVGILLDSFEATVNYTTGGLGLVHVMYNEGDVLENHYDPDPREWPEYTGASADGIGRDRTSDGNGFAGQYPDPVAEVYDDPGTCPEELLLFFHHLPWEFELDDGTTVVQRLYDNLHDGVDTVRRLRGRWADLEGRVDDDVHRHTLERFDEQVAHATVWRDHLAAFFHEHADVPDERGRVPREDPAERRI